MLSRLYLNGCFRHQDVTFNFASGLTGIVGPNESGKSLIVEMIRFALFGSEALRGTAEDYKKLHVELDFIVNGTSYTVVRKGSRAELVGIANGIKPTNDAVKRILGYDLTVFDVANVCNQGDVEKLTDMRPAQRKEMVDQTVGLNSLDVLIDHCGAEGNALKRQAAGMEATLVKPDEPIKPDDYRPSGDLRLLVEEYEALSREYQQLQGVLSQLPEKPVAPAACVVTTPLADLLAAEEARDTVQLAVNQVQRQLKGLELPDYTSRELDDFEAQWVAYEQWTQKKRLLAQGEEHCPSCGHTWPIAGEKLDAFADVVETGAPSVSQREIARQRSLQDNSGIIDTLKADLALMVVPDSLAASITVRRAYEAQIQAYNAAITAYEKFTAGLAEKQARFEELASQPIPLDAARRDLQNALFYEQALETFTKANTHYERNLALHTEIATKAEAYLESRKAIQELKVKIKTHLLPSLNKVSSILLSQMTGGERYLVEIDEDFDIKIDGQSVNTLSGSGKAVANIAIRLALGQILTNRVFSVFMADEIDAAMDDERATYTSEALRRLTSTVGQVIQVTHKNPETDHIFELKK